MTTRTEIRKYLAAGHDTFTTAEVSAAIGLPIKTISTTANQMCKSGELVVESRTWRKTVYRKAGVVSEKKNSIIDDCRNSAAMKRVLSVYGVKS